jgi:hypothetical protein
MFVLIGDIQVKEEMEADRVQEGVQEAEVPVQVEPLPYAHGTQAAVEVEELDAAAASEFVNVGAEAQVNAVVESEQEPIAGAIPVQVEPLPYAQGTQVDAAVEAEQEPIAVYEDAADTEEEPVLRNQPLVLNYLSDTMEGKKVRVFKFAAEANAKVDIQNVSAITTCDDVEADQSSCLSIDTPSNGITKG